MVAPRAGASQNIVAIEVIATELASVAVRAWL
jgi:hypothetical protein